MSVLSVFEELYSINVNEYIEERSDGNKTLKYLSWTFAWSEFKKKQPDATYEIKKFFNAEGALVPYMYDKNTGYMVNTVVKAGGIEHEMWLPVMDSKNKAMKAEPYTYTTKKGDRTVDAATMFDINSAIMRCLVKNLAMFGLGLYIYAGEDLPEDMGETENLAKTKMAKSKSLEEMIKTCEDEKELSEIYRANKTTICSNPTLLSLITDKGRKLTGAA